VGLLKGNKKIYLKARYLAGLAFLLCSSPILCFVYPASFCFFL